MVGGGRQYTGADVSASFYGKKVFLLPPVPIFPYQEIIFR